MILCASMALVGACGGAAESDAVTTPAPNAKASPEPAAGAAEAPPSTALTDEELRLMEADPATLRPDERRKRAYAIRKKIMQDPTSPEAQAILEGARAIEAGEVEVPADLRKDPESSGPVLSAPNLQPGPEK
jgi:hypothetical protein